MSTAQVVLPSNTAHPLFCTFAKGRHDTLINGILYNEIEHNDNQHNYKECDIQYYGTQHNDIPCCVSLCWLKFMVGITIKSIKLLVIMMSRQLAEVSSVEKCSSLLHLKVQCDFMLQNDWLVPYNQ
jgi:hypothetical protein